MNLEDRALLLELLDEIARSAFRGNHRFTIGRSVGRWCSENIREDSATRRRLVHLSESYSQSKPNFDASNAKLIISLGAAAPKKIHSDTWEIGHQCVVSGSFLEPACIVVEDASNDGSLYELMLWMEAKRVKFGEISFVLVNGGGGGISKEFSRTIDANRITVCLADHDRLAPQGKGSMTSQRCQVVHRKLGDSYVGNFFETPGREIENFLPFEIISSLPGRMAKSEHSVLLSLISRQKNASSGDCLWLFYDVKKGVEHAGLRRSCKAEEAKAWVCEKFQIGSFDDIDKVKISGFGEGIPEALMNSGALKGELAKFTRTSYWSDHFSYWFSCVLGFVAASEKRRT